MPPHRRTRVKSTNPEVQRLTEAMTKYYILIETCSQCLRTLPEPDKSPLYNEALEKWQHRSEFYWPDRGNEAQRAKFFSAVDEACKIESRDPENCHLIIFACAAAILVVIDQDLIKLCDPDRRCIMNGARIAATKQLFPNIDLSPTLTKTSAASRRLRVSAPRPKKRLEIIGKQISYRDPKTGQTRECTVTDKITNYLKGTYYVIADSSGWDEEVNEADMLDMLDNAVQQPSSSSIVTQLDNI